MSINPDVVNVNFCLTKRVERRRCPGRSLAVSVLTPVQGKRPIADEAGSLSSRSQSGWIRAIIGDTYVLTVVTEDQNELW